MQEVLFWRYSVLSGRSLSSRLIRWLAYVAGWTLFALFSSARILAVFCIKANVSRPNRPVARLSGGPANDRVCLGLSYPNSSGGWQAVSPSSEKTDGEVADFILRRVSLFAVIEAVLFAGITPLFGVPWFPRKTLPLPFGLGPEKR